MGSFVMVVGNCKGDYACHYKIAQIKKSNFVDIPENI